MQPRSLYDMRAFQPKNFNLSRPYCIGCRRAMSFKSKRSGGRSTFRCGRCKSNVTGGFSKPLTNERRPCCIQCKRFMCSNGMSHEGKECFICIPCGVSVVSHYSGHRRKSHSTGERLIEIATRALPTRLPAEIKEEARQAIVLDLLTKKIKPDALKDSQLVKRYVRDAWGLQDRYRFRSLDEPLKDGDCTLGELIAA